MSEDRSFDLSTAARYVLFIADRSCRKIGVSTSQLPYFMLLCTGSRAYARKVGTRANSALIRYCLPRLKLSIALLSRKRGNECLADTNIKQNYRYIISNNNYTYYISHAKSDMYLQKSNYSVSSQSFLMWFSLLCACNV